MATVGQDVGQQSDLLSSVGLKSTTYFNSSTSAASTPEVALTLPLFSRDTVVRHVLCGTTDARLMSA